MALHRSIDGEASGQPEAEMATGRNVTGRRHPDPVHPGVDLARRHPGLTAKSPDGASAFSYPLIFLPFISSAFVPTDTMPGPVRAFAEHQPVTPIVNAIRDLFTQQPVGTDIWIALAAVGPGKAVPGGAVPPGLDAEAAGTVARLILGDGDQEPARPVD
jgi:hypothetical protein